MPVSGPVKTPAGWNLLRGSPPGPGRGPGFLWKKAGGKTTRAERGSLRPGPTSLWLVAREGFSFFAKLACGPASYARNGPPTGWAGWEAWFRRREGATLYPTFPCRNKKGGSRLSPQRNFSPAPLGNPVAPSSVTFGDSFPPRGSLWVVLPYTKKASQIRVRRWAPKQPPYRNTAPHHAKTSEWQRAGHKKGGPGGKAPGPLSPHFSGEMGTPPGRRAPGALRPEASQEPRPPEGYAVPYRAPSVAAVYTRMGSPVSVSRAWVR